MNEGVMQKTPREHVSISQVNMFRRCPAQYSFRYVDGRVIPPRWTMFAGKKCHNTLEFNNVQKMITGLDVDISTAQDFFHTEWRKGMEEEEVKFDCRPVDARESTIRTLTHYLKDNPDKDRVPRDVEKEFNVNLKAGDDEVLVKGFIDVVFDGIIKDYKFSSRAAQAIDLHNDIQLTLYSHTYFMEHKVIPDAYFDYMINTKTPKKEIIMIQRTPAMIERTLKDIHDSAKLISLCFTSGLFPRKTDGWHCHPDQCGYWEICRPDEKKIWTSFEKSVKALRPKKG
jgi:putative RecB family exonuclease